MAITTTAMSAYIPEVWSGKLLTKFYKSTVFGSIANTAYEGEITKLGDKVHIRIVPDITIYDYDISTGIANTEKPTTQKVELNIDKAKYFSFAANDIERKQADIAYVEKWSDDAAQQMKIAIDTDIWANIYDDPASDNKGTTAGAISSSVNLGTTGSAVSITSSNVVDYIVNCGLVLDEQNIPDSDRWLIAPAWFMARIKTSELKDASMTGDGKSILRNGRVGMIDRFTLYSSNSVKSVTDGSDTCFYVMFGHKSALTFASQLVENRIIDNPDDFGKLVQGLQVYGYKTLLSTAIGALYCKAG